MILACGSKQWRTNGTPHGGAKAGAPARDNKCLPPIGQEIIEQIYVPVELPQETPCRPRQPAILWRLPQNSLRQRGLYLLPARFGKL